MPVTVLKSTPVLKNKNNEVNEVEVKHEQYFFFLNIHEPDDSESKTVKLFPANNMP